MALLPERTCAHDGGLVFTSGDCTRCADCQAEMVWCTKTEWDKLQRPLSDAERDLLNERAGEHQVLLGIYHRLGDLLMRRGRL